MNNDILCSVKSINVTEVTIRRKRKDPCSKLEIFDDLGYKMAIPISYQIIKQYYNENGELLAERNVTFEGTDLNDVSGLSDTSSPQQDNKK